MYHTGKEEEEDKGEKPRCTFRETKLTYTIYNILAGFAFLFFFSNMLF